LNTAYESLAAEWCSYAGTDDRKMTSYVRSLVKRCDEIFAVQVTALAQHYTVLRTSERADNTRENVSAMWIRLENQFGEEAIAAAAVAEAGTEASVPSPPPGLAKAGQERKAGGGRWATNSNLTAPSAWEATTEDIRIRDGVQDAAAVPRAPGVTSAKIQNY